MMERMPRCRSWSILLTAVVALAHDAGAQTTCSSGQHTYTFTNWCRTPIWIGQRSTGDPAAYPPLSGNWAIAGRCKQNADCPSQVCDANSGQCVCSGSTCPGGAVCEADGKCSSVATFCMPSTWTSGTFWPRTGCTLDGATLSCATGQCYDTRNTGAQLLDCSINNHGGSPTNPVTQFEVTATPTGVNYDVSL